MVGGDWLCTTNGVKELGTKSVWMQLLVLVYLAISKQLYPITEEVMKAYTQD
jgi:hypothetical protein